MVRFEEVSQEGLNSNINALDMLSIAAEDFGGLIHAKNIRINEKQKVFFVYKKETELLGVFYLTFSDQEVGHVMTLVLLGGENFLEWKDQFEQFLWELADKYHVDDFTYLGRPGFSKLFKRCKEIARLYRITRFD